MSVSIIIPARNEVYLVSTIKDVLSKARGDIEVIVVLDGWLPEPQIHTHDNRVLFLYNKESVGQRKAINQGVERSTKKFIMKLDAHCAVGPGFDEILAADCAYDMTMIPRMYNLDTKTWTPRYLDDWKRARLLRKVHDYMYIGWNEKDEMRTLYYPASLDKKMHSRKELVDETMSCMGCCFFMHKERFLELGGCDEGHGGWGQQGVEVALKAWLSGGRLMVNKKTWFAHWFRAGDGGFPYHISGGDIDRARKYSMNLWLNNKWEHQTRSIEWLVDKFDPPSWEGRLNNDFTPTKLQRYFYNKIHLKGHDPRWRGIKVIKLPTDFLLYSQAIWEKRPDFIVEIGTAFCGSALFFADMMDINGKGKVISIDIEPRGPLKEHPRITYLKGDSKSPDIIKQVKDMVGGSVMVSIDGNHKRSQVKWELKLYADIVTSGQYMVVEDCYDRQGLLTGPGEARDWFLKWNDKFFLSDWDEKYIIGFTKGGWLMKR